ncbi:MAG: hypothetical protein ABIQ86_14085 [Steroidobacteraceae bacterium]
MNRAITAAILLASLGTLVACAQKPDASSTSPAATPPPGPTQSAPQRVDPEDPKAGTNTNRPDSMKDVKPGTP